MLGGMTNKIVHVTDLEITFHNMVTILMCTYYINVQSKVHNNEAMPNNRCFSICC